MLILFRHTSCYNNFHTGLLCFLPIILKTLLGPLRDHRLTSRYCPVVAILGKSKMGAARILEAYHNL